MCHPRCVYENWKWYVIKHNYVTEGVFNGYTGQLYVSAYTGHLQVVLRELKVLIYALNAHVVQRSLHTGLLHKVILYVEVCSD